MFRGYIGVTSLVITSYQCWLKLFADPKYRIVDEYGAEYTADEMIAFIEAKRRHGKSLPDENQSGDSFTVSTFF